MKWEICKGYLPYVCNNSLRGSDVGVTEFQHLRYSNDIETLIMTYSTVELCVLYSENMLLK